MDRLTQLSNFLKDDPNNSFIRFAVAKEYEGLKQTEEALNAYLSLKKDDPSYVGLYYHYAKLLEKQEDFDQAIVIYKEGLAQAKAQGDKHAYGELESALWEISED